MIPMSIANEMSSHCHHVSFLGPEGPKGLELHDMSPLNKSLLIGAPETVVLTQVSYVLFPLRPGG